MELAAQRGLEAMNSAETNPNERGLGKPCAGKPPARFDEGESSVAGNRFAALPTLLSAVKWFGPKSAQAAAKWIDSSNRHR